MWRSVVEQIDGRLRNGALGNAWSAMVAEHVRARDWAEAWEALEGKASAQTGVPRTG